MASRALKQTGKAVAAGCGLVLLAAVLCPWLLAPYSPADLTAPYQRPDAAHPLGTNAIGQDLLTLLIFATRTSLSVGLFSALLATSVGVLAGLAAGYYRGMRDELLMRAADLFMLLPALPLIILLAAYLNPGAGGIILVIAGTAWPGTARVVRSCVLQVREAGYVRSARGLGAGPRYIMARHIFPNILEIVLAKGLLTAAGAMVAEAGVSFLGLSDPAFLSWGTMIHDAFAGGALVNGCTWWYLPAVGCISATVLVLTLTGQTATAPSHFAPFAARPLHSCPTAPAACVQPALLSVENLTVDFVTSRETVHRALDGIHLSLAEGDRVAVVGHTGSGKSILLLALLRLLPENAVVSGSLRYREIDLCAIAEQEMTRVRGRELAYVPQGTGDALNPLLSVGTQIAEAGRIHLRLGKAAAMAKAVSLLAQVGIERPYERSRDFPHRYSGGMLQRALLAAALACGAPLLLVDEPTKGLDPDSCRQILDTLRRLESRTILLVTHDLGFAEQVATRVVVMCAARVVETAAAEAFFAQPLHPYSQALLAAQPERGLQAPAGVSLARTAEERFGCPFRRWCEKAFARCIEPPPMVEAGGHQVRCWQYVPDSA